MIARLQSLRFIAAGLVLVGHVLMEIHQHVTTANASGLLDRMPWGVGVDIFFVISGFIIAHATADRPRSLASVLDFLVNRVIRIWPTYAFFTLLMLLAVVLVPGFLRFAHVDMPYLLASVAFIPWPRPSDGALFPLLGQGWTLNYEMFFYLTFALALLLPKSIRTISICVGAASLIIVGLTVPLPRILQFYSQPVIAEFVLGVLLARFYRQIPDAPVVGGCIIAAAFAFLLITDVDTQTPSRAIFAGIPAAVIVGGFLMLGTWGERHVGRASLVLLGNASYALYLCHPFIVNALLWLFLHSFVELPVAAFAITAIAASTFASVVTYKVLEQPTLNLLRKAYQARVYAAPTLEVASTRAS